MESRILLNFFLFVALVFIGSANGAGAGRYKVLEYGEEFSHPWHNHLQPARTPRIQRRQDDNEGFDDFAPDNRDRSEFDPNRTVLPSRANDKSSTKRKSSFEEINKLNNFRKESGANFVYSRMPMPIILISSYPKPSH